MTAHDRPPLVGVDRAVPLVTGQMRRYVNLDYAASTPPLVAVARAVDALLPWYSSVHRGAGFPSQVSTAAYEGARQAVRTFIHARPGDAIIFTRNTTDAINLFASSLPDDAHVLAFAVEHHANMLPWRGHVRVSYLPVPASPDDALATLDDALTAMPAGYRLVAVTGASNVTGEVWPLDQIVRVAHRHEARVLVDAAQLAPHFPIDMQASDVDYLALSAHKMYAPFGSGALIGRDDWLRDAPPFLSGGGAVDFVTLDDVMWTSLPDRQEAGSPNVLGAVALGVACQALRGYGMDRLAAEELELAAYARRRLAEIPGITLYELWRGADVPRLGIVAFNVEGFYHSHLATILSAEHGVGVRHGCFCAHPFMQQLLDFDATEAASIRHDIACGRKDRVPGAVRISIGLGTTRQDIDDITQALMTIVTDGPSWGYRVVEASGEYVPDPETRLWPDLPLPLHSPMSIGGESSCHI